MNLFWSLQKLDGYVEMIPGLRDSTTYAILYTIRKIHQYLRTAISKRKNNMDQTTVPRRMELLNAAREVFTEKGLARAIFFCRDVLMK